MKRNIPLIAALLFALTIHGSAQTIFRVQPRDTDDQIGLGDFGKNPRDSHFVAIDKSVTPRNKCFVMLPGMFGNPEMYTEIVQNAARDGFHAFVLCYPNRWTIETELCVNSPSDNCFAQARQEVLTGQDVSPDVICDRANSIENRLVKMMMFLAKSYPTDGWNQFVTDSTLNWTKLVLAGHSQGAGFAVFAGIKHEVARVVMLGGPRDFSTYFKRPASWYSKDFSETYLDQFFGLSHTNDLKVLQSSIWSDLGLAPPSNSTTIYDGRGDFPGKRMLWLNVEPYNDTSALRYHNSVAVDQSVPRDSKGVSINRLWSYLSGVDIGVGVEDDELDSPLRIHPNPASSSLTFSGIKGEIQLVDFTGRVLQRFQVENVQVPTSIDVSNLVAGTYALRTGTHCKPFMVTR